MSTPVSARSQSFFPLRRVAAWQLIATLAIAALGGWWAGMHGALSALLGGLLVISASVVYAVVVRVSSSGDRSAGGTVRTMIRAEAAKITMIVLQLWLVLTTYHDAVLAPFFLAFVVSVLVSTAAITIRD